MNTLHYQELLHADEILQMNRFSAEASEYLATHSTNVLVCVQADAILEVAVIIAQPFVSQLRFTRSS